MKHFTLGYGDSSPRCIDFLLGTSILGRFSFLLDFKNCSMLALRALRICSMVGLFDCASRIFPFAFVKSVAAFPSGM